MSYKYYLKKLTSNELGYRKGKLTNGQMFYISKQAADFFPPLSKEVNNDSAMLEFNVEYKEDPIFLNLVYHNDKFNREDGTRDEYRIYLNREIAPDDFFFRPGDIIVIERKMMKAISPPLSFLILISRTHSWGGTNRRVLWSWTALDGRLIPDWITPGGCLR